MGFEGITFLPSILEGGVEVGIKLYSLSENISVEKAHVKS